MNIIFLLFIHTILITSLSLEKLEKLEKYTFYYEYVKQEKYILHARHTFPFAVSIFFKRKVFEFFNLEIYLSLSNPFFDQ